MTKKFDISCDPAKTRQAPTIAHTHPSEARRNRMDYDEGKLSVTNGHIGHASPLSRMACAFVPLECGRRSHACQTVPGDCSLHPGVLCVHRWLQWCQEIAPCTQICTTSLLSRLNPRAPGNGEAALCSALLGQCACELDEGLRNRYLPSRGTPTACPTMARNSPTVAVARCSRKALRNSSSMRFKNFAFE